MQGHYICRCSDRPKLHSSSELWLFLQSKHLTLSPMLLPVCCQKVKKRTVGASAWPQTGVAAPHDAEDLGRQHLHFRSQGSWRGDRRLRSLNSYQAPFVRGLYGLRITPCGVCRRQARDESGP